MIAPERVAAFGSRSTISGWVAIFLSPESSRFARDRVRRRPDYPAAFGLDPSTDVVAPREGNAKDRSAVEDQGLRQTSATRRRVLAKYRSHDLRSRGRRTMLSAGWNGKGVVAGECRIEIGVPGRRLMNTPAVVLRPIPSDVVEDCETALGGREEIDS